MTNFSFKVLAATIVSAMAIGVSAEQIKWYDGQHAVTFNVLKNTEPVVKMALDMFCGDMEAVTGKRAKASRRKAAICIIHLDNASYKGWNCWSKRCV